MLSILPDINGAEGALQHAEAFNIFSRVQPIAYTLEPKPLPTSFPKSPLRIQPGARFFFRSAVRRCSELLNSRGFSSQDVAAFKPGGNRSRHQEFLKLFLG